MNDEPLRPAGRGSILLIAEELDQRTDEGYAKFTREVARVLAESHSVLTHTTELPRGGDSRPGRALSRLRALLAAAHSPELKGDPPKVILYASRSSATLAALVRARLLRAAGRGAKVAMVALQPREAALASRLPLRWLRPDLLLVGTERERAAALRRGIRAECVWGGVDLVRFRPADGGEKEALRRKWGLPVEDRVTPHRTPAGGTQSVRAAAAGRGPRHDSAGGGQHPAGAGVGTDQRRTGPERSESSGGLPASGRRAVPACRLLRLSPGFDRPRDRDAALGA